jgi:hypothetical protein
MVGCVVKLDDRARGLRSPRTPLGLVGSGPRPGRMAAGDCNPPYPPTLCWVRSAFVRGSGEWLRSLVPPGFRSWVVASGRSPDLPSRFFGILFVSPGLRPAAAGLGRLRSACSPSLSLFFLLSTFSMLTWSTLPGSVGVFPYYPLRYRRWLW